MNKQNTPGNGGMQRQWGRGDPPKDPAPPLGVWERYTQREHPGNYTPPRGAAHKDTHTRDRGGAQASKRSRETNTCSDRGDAGTRPMIQPHHRGYGSVSLSGSTPETTLHHAGQPTRTRSDNPDSNTNCQMDPSPVENYRPMPDDTAAPGMEMSAHTSGILENTR